TKIGENLYLVDTLYGSALINGKGKLIKAFYNAFQLTIAGDYFVGERAIRFDAEMKKAASTETPDALAVIPVKNQLYYATMHQINRTTIK
ncbi:MAG: hypothetical protein J6C75_03660, partial [Oscillospiraceae bacterium]|nr:hypothetical protein [Oscillospiraceae bacterium]